MRRQWEGNKMVLVKEGLKLNLGIIGRKKEAGVCYGLSREIWCFEQRRLIDGGGGYREKNRRRRRRVGTGS